MVAQYNKPYLSVKETATRTGLSQRFLRRLNDAGRLPHVKSGNRTLVNVPKLLEQLEAENGQTERV